MSKQKGVAVIGDLITKIPVQGVGIGYRREIAEQIFASADRLDLVEIITEQFSDPYASEAELGRLCHSFRVFPAWGWLVYWITNPS